MIHFDKHAIAELRRCGLEAHVVRDYVIIFRRSTRLDILLEVLRVRDLSLSWQCTSNECDFVMFRTGAAESVTVRAWDWYGRVVFQENVHALTETMVRTADCELRANGATAQKAAAAAAVTSTHTQA